jgi:hypothetical protein
MKTEKKTYSGALLTIVTILVVLVYAVNAFMLMLKRSSIIVYSQTGYDDGLVQSANGYGVEQKMHFAFGVGSFFATETSQDAYLDYGTLNIYYQ